MSSPSEQGGYTLLEVIVAFAILSVSLAVLYESFGLSTMRASRSTHLAEAALVSASIRDKLSAEPALSVGSQSGAEGYCRWQSNTEEVTRSSANIDVPLRAFEIRVEASCGEGKSARSVTLQLFEFRGRSL